MATEPTDFNGENHADSYFASTFQHQNAWQRLTLLRLRDGNRFFRYDTYGRLIWHSISSQHALIGWSVEPKFCPDRYNQNTFPVQPRLFNFGFRCDTFFASVVPNFSSVQKFSQSWKFQTKDLDLGFLESNYCNNHWELPDPCCVCRNQHPSRKFILFNICFRCNSMREEIWQTHYLQSYTESYWSFFHLSRASLL